MNSTQRQILRVLEASSMRAVRILDALRLAGFKGSIEAVYGELVALEAQEHVCIEAVYERDRRVASVWALGRIAPSPEPDLATAEGSLDPFGMRANAPWPGGRTIHRCL